MVHDDDDEEDIDADEVRKGRELYVLPFRSAKSATGFKYVEQSSGGTYKARWKGATLKSGCKTPEEAAAAYADKHFAMHHGPTASVHISAAKRPREQTPGVGWLHPTPPNAGSITREKRARAREKTTSAGAREAAHATQQGLLKQTASAATQIGPPLNCDSSAREKRAHAREESTSVRDAAQPKSTNVRGDAIAPPTAIATKHSHVAQRQEPSGATTEADKVAELEATKVAVDGDATTQAGASKAAPIATAQAVPIETSQLSLSRLELAFFGPEHGHVGKAGGLLGQVEYLEKELLGNTASGGRTVIERVEQLVGVQKRLQLM